MIDGRTTQSNLVAKGYKIAIDGQMGPKTFAALLNCTAQRPTPLAPALGLALANRLDAAGINTALRLRHFLAQTACETAGFTVMEEKASGMAYEGRKDLGNIYPGDGPRYKGRGLLDTTGRWNYEHLHDLTQIDCVRNPDVLEVPDTAVQAAVAFWIDKGINAAADADDLKHVTLLVNGGYNGINDRQIYYDRTGVIR